MQVAVLGLEAQQTASRARHFPSRLPPEPDRHFPSRLPPEPDTSPADCLQSPTLPHNSRSPRWRAVRGYFYPQRTPGNICRRFQLSQLEECYRILEGKAKDAVNLLPGSRQVPALNHSAPNVSDGASQVLQWYKPACQCRRL